MGSLTDELSSIQAFKRLNETVDRTGEPRGTKTDGLCICILGSSSRHLDVLLEGGDICLGDVVIALSPNWLQRETVEDLNDGEVVKEYPRAFKVHKDDPGAVEVTKEDPRAAEVLKKDPKAVEVTKEDPRAVEVLKNHPRQVLLVKKALTFERGGNSYLDVFQPPRRVTYFINEMPESFNALGLDCAMNGSDSTMSLLEDRLLWRLELSKTKVSLPPCIVLHGDLSPGFQRKLENIPKLKLVKRSENEDKGVSLEQDISELMSTVPTARRKVVTGKRISGVFHRKIIPDDDSIFRNGLLKEWQNLCEDEYITIETVRLLPYSQIGITASAIHGTPQDKLFSVGARLTVCRGLDDQLIFSRISATATLSSQRHRPGSVYKDLATCLMDLGYTDPGSLERVKENMKTQARAMMNLVVDFERSPNGSYIGPRTDYLELTFDLMLLQEVMTPVLSDVSNQHTCLDTWGDNSNGPLTPARLILHVMALRSHSILLSGKRILFLLDGNYIDVRMEFFKDLHKFGNKTIVLAAKDTPRARQYADEVVVYDLEDGTDYIHHAENILKLLQQRGIMISGCITLNENFGHVASQVRQLLDLPGVSIEATNAANDKYLTYSKLWTTPSSRYSSKAVKVGNLKDLDMSCSKIDYPAFAKMNARGAIGARIVNHVEDCKKYITLLSKEINNNENLYELINGRLSFVLTELHKGDEYIVDVVLFHGQFIAGFIRLVDPANPPHFTSRAQAFPAQLPADKEASLLRASHQMCYDLGLHDGVFNVELMDTEEGPKLIEINNRPGGHGIQPLTKHCFDEDIFMMNNLVHTGIRPTVVPLPPRRFGYSFLLSLRHHFHLANDDTFRGMVDTLQERNMIIYQRLRASNNSTVDKVIAFLGVVDEDMDKSKIILLAAAKALGLDTAEYPCADFLESLSLRNGIPRSI